MGTPPSPPPDTVLSVGIVAADRYTRTTLTGSLNVSWPLPPVATPPPLSTWSVLSGTQLDIALPAGTITDPENGTLALELRRDDGTDGGQPLPDFVVFASDGVRVTVAPQAGDIETHHLVLIGRSRWGSWQGSARVVLIVVVEESWSDFFARVYKYLRSVGSAVAAVTWCLVQRALLMNLVLFRYRFRKAPPPSLLSGEHTYVLGTASSSSTESEQEQPPTPTPLVLAVQVRYVERPATERRWWQLPDYVAMHGRCAEVSLKTDFIGGVPWLRASATATQNAPATVVLRADVAMLQRLVACGQAAVTDEYYLEVLRTGLWYNGTLLEAFCLRVADLLSSTTATAAAVDVIVLNESDDCSNNGGGGGGLSLMDYSSHNMPNKGFRVEQFMADFVAMQKQLKLQQEKAAALQSRIVALEGKKKAPSAAASAPSRRQDPYFPDANKTPQYLLPLPSDDDYLVVHTQEEEVEVEI